jgi:hypothetical protein
MDVLVVEITIYGGGEDFFYKIDFSEGILQG